MTGATALRRGGRRGTEALHNSETSYQWEDEDETRATETVRPGQIIYEVTDSGNSPGMRESACSQTPAPWFVSAPSLP